MTSKFSGMALEVEKPSRMIVVHPVSRQPLRSADGVEAFIDLYSGDSDPARRHQRAVSRRRLAVRGRAKVTPEEIETEGVELLAAITAGWNLVGLDGASIDVPFSIENARELYADPAVAWLRDQVDEFASDRGNFSKPSPKL